MSNKEFYVRHGLVVNNTVLTANVITNNVGIGTNNAAYTLDVIGNANISQPRLFVAGTNVLATLNSAYTIVNAAYDSANSNWAVQNALYTLANTVYDSSNSNWTVQNLVYATVNANYVMANANYDLTNTVYASSNSNWVVQNAIYDLANTIYASGNSNWQVQNALYDLTNTVYASSNSNWVVQNLVYATVNANYVMSNAGYTTLNAAYDTVNSVYASSNSNWVVQNLVYATVNSAYMVANASYANANAVAIGANNWANTKLSNTNNVWTAGSLNIAQDLYVNRNITNVTQLIFNTGTNITPTTPGALTWSQDDSTLHFDMDTPSNVIQHIGQDQFYLVKNQTGETITKGTAVRFAGTLGASGRLLIAKATANNSIPSRYIMGVTAADIGNGADGFVYSFGKLRGIDTSAFSEGDVLYLSSTVPGGYQNTEPTAPNNKISMAAVIYSSPTNGTIQIRPTPASQLGDDELVQLNGLANGDFIRYNSANARFENFNENATGPAINAVAAFAKVNSVAIAANAWSNTVGVAGNNWTNTVGMSANSYAGFMVNSSNSYANATYVKLTASTQTITGDITVAGNVNINKDLHVSGNIYFTDQQTLSIGDPLIYLAANNYSSDLVDIGFVANYVNATSVNVHTGLYRSSISKEYYLFQEYNKEPYSNYIDYTGNNFTLAVLNADIITNNLTLGTVNATSWIRSSFDTANAAYNNANVGLAAANTWANTVGIAGNNYTNYVGASVNSYMLYVTTSGNTYAGQMANSSNAWANAVGVAGNSVTYAVGNAGNSYTQQVGTAGNNYTNAVGLAGNNYTNSVGLAGNNYTNQVGLSVNTYTSILASNNAIGANNWANTVGIAGNNYTNAVGVAGNNYTNYVGASVNSYAQQVGAAGNNYTNYVGTSVNAYATATYATLSNTAIVYNTSNVAFDTANAAFAVANNVAPQIAPSYNTANNAYRNSNSAFDTANAAFASANNVAPQVTPSYNTANAAYRNSNSAFDVANAAYNTANADYAATNAVFGVANAAFAAANNVAPQVTPSYNTANAAYFNSNLAYNTANAAYGAANNISPQLAPVFNTANSAYNTANLAYSLDNVVFGVVNAAFAKANSGGATISATSPSTPSAGSLWWDSTYGKLYIYYTDVDSSQWVEAAPAPAIDTSFINPAFNTANAAFNVANAAYGAANNVGPQIAPAFNTANAAFAAANNISPQLAPAYNTANAAFNAANNNNTYAISTFVQLTAPNQTITGNLAVTGALTILGNTTSISSNNLIVGDSMIYLAANNYSGTDILDIGFVANYANGTGANVHTGLLRDATTKQYYLFQGLDIELFANNTAFVPYANGVVNAVLNADLVTSNLSLGGANAINWIKAAYTKANNSVGGANIGQTTPVGVSTGTLWWNPDLGKMFIYYTDPANTSSWVETSPSASAIEGAIITGYINPIYATVNAAYSSINSNWTVTNAIYGIANTALQNTNITIAGNVKIANTQSISVPIWYENETNITASYSLTAGRNAMTAGPITLNTGVTITIPVGSTWTVV